MAAIMSIREAAEVSGMSVYAIRTGIKDGIFPAFRVNGHGGKFFIDYDLFKDAVRNLSSVTSMHHGDSSSFDGSKGIRRINE